MSIIKAKENFTSNLCTQKTKRGRCSVYSQKIVASNKKRKDTKTQNFC